jgi:hypothetical protein
LAFTIASEIGAIEHFSSPEKLTGYTGLFPRVNQSGDADRRGPLTKHGPRYLRWALIEATMHALKHPAYRERYQRKKRRLGKQRGAKVAQIDVACRLTHAIWHMLTRRSSLPEAPLFVWRHRPTPMDLRPRANDPISPAPPAEEAISAPDPRRRCCRMPVSAMRSSRLQLAHAGSRVRPDSGSSCVRSRAVIL